LQGYVPGFRVQNSRSRVPGSRVWEEVVKP
jgi:hypothetical protein